MNGPAIRFDYYDRPAGREAMLRVGPGGAPTVLIAPALFEEANRTRAFTVAIMRALAMRGLASALPDLPGQGDSLVPTEQATLADWRAAFAGAVAMPVCVVTIRGGALVDTLVSPVARWRLSPIDGPTMAREMTRLASTSGDNTGLIAGNRIAPSMFADLADATPATGIVRTVRMAGDPRAADRHVTGRPLWRAAEPDNDLPLASLLADDIADWTMRCAAR